MSAMLASSTPVEAIAASGLTKGFGDGETKKIAVNVPRLILFLMLTSLSFTPMTASFSARSA